MMYEGYDKCVQNGIDGNDEGRYGDKGGVKSPPYIIVTLVISNAQE